MIDLFHKMISGVTHILCRLSSLLLIACMVIVCVDILLRNLGTPILGSLEVVSVMFCASCFFAFGETHIANRDVRVDIVRVSLGGRSKAVIEIFSASLLLALFALIGVFSSERALDAYHTAEFLEGILSVPSVYPWAAITLGALTTSLAALSTVMRNAVVLVSPRKSERPSH